MIDDRPDSTDTVAPGAAAGDPPSKIELLAPGSSLGDRYEIRRPLDAGGYGVVYLAYDRELNREVALKVLRQDRTSNDAVRRFRREVAIARDASSPYLVRVFDIESSGGAIYLTMEFIDGESLQQRIDRGPLPVAEAISIARSLLSGLGVLHRLGVIHRDVKPANVLINSAGEVKLADFGLARYFSPDASRATESGIVLGTMDYVSPEQALGSDLDIRSDLYSAGVVLFEMLTGRRPFVGTSAVGVLLARLKEAPPPVRSLRSDCPRWLDRLVERLLAREPGDRYPGADATLADLERGRVARLIPKSRRRQLFTVLTLFLLLLLGAVTAVFWPRHRFSHLTMLDDNAIAAVDGSGQTLWRKDHVFGQTAFSATLFRKDGQRLLAAVLRDNEDFSFQATHTLSLLDPDSGRPVQTVLLPDGGTNFGDHPNRYSVDNITAIDLDHDGTDELVITFCHSPMSPSFTVLYEPLVDRSRLIFCGFGHHRFGGIADVNGDGREDILLVGINNYFGWINAVAAVDVEPPVGRDLGVEGGIAYSPGTSVSASSDMLLWYALVPRGYLMGMRPKLVVADGRITIPRPEHSPAVIGLDGLTIGVRHSKGAFAAREEAYRHLREAERLFAAGASGPSSAEIELAVARAAATAEPLLLEAVQRRQGRMLIAAGRLDEGEALLDRLAHGSANASEIAFDAADELHKHGALEKAIRWYRRGYAVGADPREGKSKFDFVEGVVLALVELGRPDEALAEVDRAILMFPGAASTVSYLRSYVHWRRGEVPDVSALRQSVNAIDDIRYWQLEFAHRRGEDPQALLRRIDPDIEAHSYVRGALLSLHAELLAEVGKSEEAATLAARALELAREDRERMTFSHAHYDLVVERAARLAPAHHAPRG